MLEIIISMLVFLIGAAKKGRPRRRRGIMVANCDHELSLGTLALNTAVIDGIQGNADRPIWFVSVDGIWSIKELTDLDGPIVVGYAHSDYTVTEIKEFLEINAGFNFSDMLTRERQARKIRVAAVLQPSGGAETDWVANDGRPIRTKLNWGCPSGSTLNMFAYNRGAALTTGAEVQLSGCKVYFRPN